MSSFEELKGKRHIFQFYVDKLEARGAKATEDRDFELADLLSNVGSILGFVADRSTRYWPRVLAGRGYPRRFSA